MTLHSLRSVPAMPTKKVNAVSRRNLLAKGAGLALGGALVGDASAAEKDRTPDPYEALGVKHVINAGGTFTVLGGSVMPPGVVAAWAAASKHFVNLVDLNDKAGERIAKLVGVEAALITTGAAGAL